MLRAIIHGKAGRVDSNGESVSWRKLFKSREDLLTAAIFTRWSYLSLKAKHFLINKWIGRIELKTSAFQEIEFWSKYDLEGREFVEPDVLIRFKDFNILIEVKPPRGGNQYFRQWDRELEGYFSSSESLPLHFLAVGRNSVQANDWKVTLLTKYKHLNSIDTISWKSVAESIYNLTKDSELDYQDHRILIDMIEALKIYGVIAHPYKWTDFNKCFDDFRNINLFSISKFGDVKHATEEVMEEHQKHTFNDLMTNHFGINLEVMKAWKK